MSRYRGRQGGYGGVVDVQCGGGSVLGQRGILFGEAVIELLGFASSPRAGSGVDA